MVYLLESDIINPVLLATRKYFQSLNQLWPEMCIRIIESYWEERFHFLMASLHMFKFCTSYIHNTPETFICLQPVIKKKKKVLIFKLWKETQNTLKKSNGMIGISYQNGIWYTRMSLQILILISSLGMEHRFWFTNEKNKPLCLSLRWFIERCAVS